MPVLRTFSGILIAALLPRAAAAQVAERGDKIAVMELRKDVAIPDGTLRTLNELLLNEFHQQGKLEVVGASDIKSMLAHEETRRMFATCDDNSCLAEIGGALGVQLLAAASLGAVGEQYVFNIKILDVSRAKVLSRASELMDRDDSELIAGIRRAVGKVLAAVVGPVLADKQGDDTRPAGPDSAPGQRAAAWSWAPWVTLGVAVAAGAGAAALGGLALSDAADARTEPRDSDAWRQAAGAAEDKALGADVCIGVAGAAAVSALVLFLVRPAAAETEAAVQLEPSAALLPGGAGAGLTIRF